ncbi:MAG: hypothetical protein ACKVT2_18570 [Saprospiraceae bacterium]
MIASLSQLDLNKSYTYTNYLLWQFEGRAELIQKKNKVFGNGGIARHLRNPWPCKVG